MFNWVDHFDLFLLDFDGLLVNTEQLHYNAYKKMVESLGFVFPIDFMTYLSGAHISQEELKNLIYNHCRGLQEQYPDFKELRAIKQKFYLEWLQTGQLKLMKGVAPFLMELHRKKKRSCIVTNSPKEQVQRAQQQIPELHLIEHLVAREDYTHPKPDGECYRLAAKLYGRPHDRIIGFEDSHKGVLALKHAAIFAVEINPYPIGISAADCKFESFFDVNFA
jgi:HAD superfamily hydrolase (TIGR01509 family)